MNGQFGEKLKKLRVRAGLTQKELGDILHVSHQAVSKWERNRGLPDTSLFPDIAKALNITVDELFYGKSAATVAVSAVDSVALSPADKAENFNKKSTYKPVNATFWMVFVALAVVVFSAAVIVAVYQINRDRYIQSVCAASEVYAVESNLSVTAQYDGESFLFIRKHFFDGRVLYRYADGESDSYFYKDAVYKVMEGAVDITDCTEEDFLSSVPDFGALAFSSSDFDSIKFDAEDYHITLKTLDNLPIARHFGFTTSAAVTVRLVNRKISEIVFVEGEDTLTLKYAYGYDFTLSLPEFISA